ncbi:MAG: dienelactone hydrolase family protein [Magnetovibrio sp.]|nr:dienelactone hydrolase family protein [Magnetovibrio sp.]
MRLESGRFQLTAITPPQSPKDFITIYIEGDGRNWRGGRAPADPTPLNSPVLSLSRLDARGDAIYLARPCQFLTAEELTRCSSLYWSSRRYGPEVVEAYDRALDTLKTRYHARSIDLIGYSGGGTLAVLLAARRTDVHSLITIAGLLDHIAWTTLHDISPLKGSLNPIDVATQIAGIPQLHFIGGDDKVIPLSQAKNFITAMGSRHKAWLQVVDGYGHSCCWSEAWQQKLKEARHLIAQH